MGLPFLHPCNSTVTTSEEIEEWANYSYLWWNGSIWHGLFFFFFFYWWNLTAAWPSGKGQDYLNHLNVAVRSVSSPLERLSITRALVLCLGRQGSVQDTRTLLWASYLCSSDEKLRRYSIQGYPIQLNGMHLAKSHKRCPYSFDHIVCPTSSIILARHNSFNTSKY